MNIPVLLIDKPIHTGQSHCLKKDGKLIVASIGGGNVGEELLFAVAETLRFDSNNEFSLQIFTGLYSKESVYNALKEYENDRIKVEKFSSEFKSWLNHADISVSMAGYNSCMDVLAAGTAGLLYPFNQNQEQRLRVNKLTKHTSLELLEKEDLDPERLFFRIQQASSRHCLKKQVKLNGADVTLQLVTDWEKNHA